MTPENTVFIRRPIGCSSPLSLLYGNLWLHTIHGRAAGGGDGSSSPIPTWMCGLSPADGDALSIGGNHTMHILRRQSRFPDIAFQQ